jgi:hypothetical protein
MSTISAAIPDIISAYAVVEPTNPAPTIAIRETLGSSDGCVEMFCIGDSISESRIDQIFSFAPLGNISPLVVVDQSYGRNLYPALWTV